MSENTQFYRGYVQIGSNTNYLPVLPGVRLSAPHNWDIPPIAGNYVQTNYGEGARTAVLTFQVAVLGGGSTTPMETSIFAGSPNLFDLLLARSADGAHDTTPQDWTFYDGRVTWTLASAKVERVSMSCARGQRLTLDVTVVAPSLTGVVDSSPGLTNNVAFSGQVMTFANINFGGTSSALANKVVSFELTYQNNHTPDPTINGITAVGTASGFPNAMNASTATATLGLTYQLSDATDSAKEFGGVLAQGAFASLSITPAAIKKAVLTTGTLLMQNPNDRALTMPRQFVSVAYAVLGGLGTSHWSASSGNPLLRLTSFA